LSISLSLVVAAQDTVQQVVVAQVDSVLVLGFQ
jgi:hypothetical protein